MTKQEHIETVEQVIWDWMQSHYQESCYTTELGKFTNALCDFWKIYNNNKSEIERLKDDYAKLQELFAQYQMASDKEIKAQKEEAEKRFENNMKAVLEIEKKQAVKDFAEKLKEKARGLTLEGNKGAGFYIGNILLTNDIDELLKEYEE